MKQDEIRTTVPAKHSWHTADLEQRAAELGVDKGRLILAGVDLIMKFDPEFLDMVQSEADAINIPLWLYIQNKFIKIMAGEAAEFETGTFKTKELNEFRYINEGTCKRAITGKELFRLCKDEHIKEMLAKE